MSHHVKNIFCTSHIAEREHNKYEIIAHDNGKLTNKTNNYFLFNLTVETVLPYFDSIN